jgi:hypothetical protein
MDRLELQHEIERIADEISRQRGSVSWAVCLVRAVEKAVRTPGRKNPDPSFIDAVIEGLGYDIEALLIIQSMGYDMDDVLDMAGL